LAAVAALAFGSTEAVAQHCGHHGGGYYGGGWGGYGGGYGYGVAYPPQLVYQGTTYRGEYRGFGRGYSHPPVFVPAPRPYSVGYGSPFSGGPAYYGGWGNPRGGVNVSFGW
jgi:hypothetical protein